jgi:hypothetical protein
LPRNRVCLGEEVLHVEEAEVDEEGGGRDEHHGMDL